MGVILYSYHAAFVVVRNTGGYYVIEQARLQLHLVALNTNYYSEVNQATTESEDPDPGGQWAWLETILLKARRRRGTVSCRVSFFFLSFACFFLLRRNGFVGYAIELRFTLPAECGIVLTWILLVPLSLECFFRWMKTEPS